jgi:Flp pilus assembly protein TadG
MSQIIISLRTGKDRKRRGFILLTHAVMLLFTIAMVGLAVDAGTMYVIKGRLSSAVDAAALAAGRSVNLADTVAAAATAATATATQFFNANFPNGYLGTGTVNLTTPTFTQQTDSNGNPTGILSIAVSASVPAPTYFMRIFGINSVTVASSGTASRRGTVMILVLDISTSMNTPTTPTACAAMISAAQSFITNFTWRRSPRATAPPMASSRSICRSSRPRAAEAAAAAAPAPTAASSASSPDHGDGRRHAADPRRGRTNRIERLSARRQSPPLTRAEAMRGLLPLAADFAGSAASAPQN